MEQTSIQEGAVSIDAYQSEEVVSKSLPVFYNPVMKLNRDISVILLNALDKTNMQICDPLAGTGIRSLRFLKELKPGIAESITVNDANPRFPKEIKTNLKKNKLPLSALIIHNEDANLFLLNSMGFDYIDIDPFGPPNKFLDSAINRLSREGILAVTATDTSALCGTYPKVGLRKYWARTRKGPFMHETGLRILIRKVQLIASQYERALTPIFSYSKDHYMRVFFQCKKSKTETDKVMKLHGEFDGAGPMWLGQLWDKKLAAEMVKESKGFDKHTPDLITTIAEESKVSQVGFYDLHAISKSLKLKQVPKMNSVFAEIKRKKKHAYRTHFSPYGIRSDISEGSLITILNKL